ncbi:hypothetical protein ACFLU8_01895 [Chloroflexota bacterium]
MVTCKLCGKETRTSRELRGHKTFVHGIRADYSKIAAQLDHRSSADENKSEQELGNLVSRVAKIEYTIVELEKTFGKLEKYMAFLTTRNEIQHLASSVKLIKAQVDKHDRWFNPCGLHEAVIDLAGGPIADIERHLDFYRISNKLAGKRLRHNSQDTKS